jgi:hypothetical protein
VEGLKTLLRLAIIVTLVAPASTLADTRANQASALSGFAVTALVRAYEASGLDEHTPPPFRLQSYVVTIRPHDEVFDVWFLAPTEAWTYPVVVAARTGSIIWKAGQPANGVTTPTWTGGYTLPGVIAGEIIAAYRQASSDGFGSLRTGAYNVWYVPFGGGTDIGFEPLNGPPSFLSTAPAATPSPKSNEGCFMGVTGPSYVIHVLNGNFRIGHWRGSGCEP